MSRSLEIGSLNKCITLTFDRRLGRIVTFQILNTNHAISNLVWPNYKTSYQIFRAAMRYLRWRCGFLFGILVEFVDNKLGQKFRRTKISPSINKTMCFRRQLIVQPDKYLTVRCNSTLSLIWHRTDFIWPDVVDLLQNFFCDMSSIFFPVVNIITLQSTFFYVSQIFHSTLYISILLSKEIALKFIKINVPIHELEKTFSLWLSQEFQKRHLPRCE